MRKPLLAVGLAVSTGLGSLPVADALAVAPAGSPVAGSPPANAAPASSTTNASPNAVSGAEIVQTAMKYLGYPYSATGNSPSTGFSCIGFVSFVYRSLGINLPGDLGDALAYAPQVPFSSLEPGDILYFQNTLWNGLSHAAIYIGGGRFIHAEYYGYGVTISSFYNDRRDGNYWISKYLGANRPWSGAAVPPVVSSASQGPKTPSSGTPGVTTAPGTSVVKTVANGPTALVSVPSLYVRSGPSAQSAARESVPSGTSVVILGQKNGWYQGKRQVWYKVQLPDGTVGWVVGFGIGMGGSTTTPAASTSSASGPGASAPAGNPTAPSRITSTAQQHVSTSTASVRVSSLNVRASPGLNAPIVGSVSQGQKLQVIGHKNGWVEVVLPDGTVGWIYGAYTSVKQPAGQNSSPTSPAQQKSSSSSRQPAAAGTVSSSTTSSASRRVTTGVNVRSGPSLNSSIITTLAPGQAYQILGWSNGWAHVRTSTGAVGWISGSVIGPGASGSSSTTSASSSGRKAASVTSSGGSVLTAGVRIHSAPGMNSRVIGSAAAGTHVQVLSYSGGWALVRLPSGQTGYVLGTYVKG